MRRILPLLLLLGSCGENRATSPTSEQSDQLNEAESLLNQAAEEETRPRP